MNVLSGNNSLSSVKPKRTLLGKVECCLAAEVTGVRVRRRSPFLLNLHLYGGEVSLKLQKILERNKAFKYVSYIVKGGIN
jgi:hypothetical protein